MFHCLISRNLVSFSRNDQSIQSIIFEIFILWYLRSELDKYWLGGKSKDLSKKYRGKTFVDDVEYEVNEGKAEKHKGDNSDVK